MPKLFCYSGHFTRNPKPLDILGRVNTVCSEVKWYKKYSHGVLLICGGIMDWTEKLNFLDFRKKYYLPRMLFLGNNFVTIGFREIYSYLYPYNMVVRYWSFTRTGFKKCFSFFIRVGENPSVANCIVNFSLDGCPHFCLNTPMAVRTCKNSSHDLRP